MTIALSITIILLMLYIFHQDAKINRLEIQNKDLKGVIERYDMK